ncbi:MAG TPA: arginine--tRNA ligase [Candidatus Saccharimonadales bacterium]|nr:arginine--tRNA ligase [Candidatus Saccharimonadales bacterium]
MTLKEQIKNQLTTVVNNLGIKDVTVLVDYPADATHGDYSTNVALIAAKKAGKNPMELAEKIVEELTKKNTESKMFNEIHVAKPGFINFWLSSEALVKSLSISTEPKSEADNKKIMVEFAHPNTHKAFHIGHLRNITTGESLIRLLEAVGAKVIRANYQGDVGMHIAKAMFGLTMLIGEDKIDLKGLEFENSSNVPERILNIVKALGKRDIQKRISLLGEAYAYGSKLFEENGKETAAIKEINKSIYNHEWGIYKPYEEVYTITRQWSLDYFNEIYKRVYSHFDRLYFESETFQPGKENVLKGLEKGIFEKSDGAIIFPGSIYGLHDRVFISSEGNPTYEGKDMGLAPLQHKEYHPDLIIHVLGPEQYGYTRVIFKALDLLFPEDAGKQLHLVYGWVKLKHGKMSSRTGNVILGEWLLDEAKKKILESYDIKDEVAEQVAIGAVKYSFLKVGLNQEIAFDLEESISLQGNSGPYLQYTYARTQSVLAKSQIAELKSQKFAESVVLKVEERNILRLLSRFPEIVEEAAVRYSPNILCTYLFELAQAFNLFYQKFPILKAEENEKKFRLMLTDRTGETLKKGLDLLGIQAPEKM